MNLFKKILNHLQKPKIVHVFLFKGTQNWIIWNALNYQLPLSEQKFVIGDGDEIYTKHKFCIPFDYNHDGYQVEDIRKCIEKHFYQKNAQYIFYATDRWANALIPFLHYLPKEKIKQIKMYEESRGEIFTKDTKKYIISAEELQKNIDNLNTNAAPIYQYSFHTLYPTKYYFGFKDLFLTLNEQADFFKYLTGSEIENLGFQELSEYLLDCEKQLIYKFFKFNFKEYQERFNNKEIHIFIVGHGVEGYQEDQIKNEKLLVGAIKSWYQKYYQNENQLFFIKLGRHKKVCLELLKKNDIKIPVFPYSIPFEILILANLLPRTVSGTDCALYINLPNEVIGTMYGDGHWTRFLRKLNKIKDEQIEMIG